MTQEPVLQNTLSHHHYGSIPFIQGHYHKKIWKYQIENIKITFSKSHPDLLGSNELIYTDLSIMHLPHISGVIYYRR